ncbi:hypothetical protein Agub_g9552, partial [Astrephomene gubernaculifera]
AGVAAGWLDGRLAAAELQVDTSLTGACMHVNHHHQMSPATRGDHWRTLALHMGLLSGCGGAASSPAGGRNATEGPTGAFRGGGRKETNWGCLGRPTHPAPWGDEVLAAAVTWTCD